jgi:hypothetical protein
MPFHIDQLPDESAVRRWQRRRGGSAGVRGVGGEKTRLANWQLSVVYYATISL